jgi:hypothetical protein
VNDIIPATRPISSFRYAVAELSASAAIVRHRRGKFVTSDGELPLGTRLAVHGWMKFNGPGKPPTRIVAAPEHPKPNRDTLGDQDEALWQLDPNGHPSDPWVEFVEAIVTRRDFGVQYTLSATASTARHALSQLAHQIVWGQRLRGEEAVLVIELQSREINGTLTYDVPVYPIVDWIIENICETKLLHSPDTSSEQTNGDKDPGLERARAALKKRFDKDLDDAVAF